MAKHVLLQQAGPGKVLFTYCTDVRPIACMSIRMVRQRLEPAERLKTYATQELTIATNHGNFLSSTTFVNTLVVLFLFAVGIQQ